METPDLYVPNYMSFHNDNIFLGSYQGMRFRLSPDLQENIIHGEYWFGPLCYELSEMDGAKDFPLTDEGIADMTQWLRELVGESRHTPPAPGEICPADK